MLCAAQLEKQKGASEKWYQHRHLSISPSFCSQTWKISWQGNWPSLLCLLHFNPSISFPVCFCFILDSVIFWYCNWGPRPMLSKVQQIHPCSSIQLTRTCAFFHHLTMMAQWLKNLPAIQRHRRYRFNWVGKIPWGRKWQPAPVFLPEKSHRQKSLAAYSPKGRNEICHKTKCLHRSLPALTRLVKFSHSVMSDSVSPLGCM